MDKAPGQSPSAEEAVVSRKMKLGISNALYLCHFVMGLGFGFLGASLLELRLRFDTDIPTVSRVFTFLSVSFTVGAFLGGIAFRWVNRQLATITLVALMGAGLICQGQVQELWAFCVATAVFGFGCGGLETAHVVWIIEMWREEAGPYIQAQHFTFALGTFVSPLLVKPFLTVGEEEQDMEPTASSNLHIPFLVAGVIAFTGSALLLILYCIKPYAKPASRKPAASPNGNVDRHSSGKWRKWTLVLFSSTFLCFYDGMEIATCQFIPTFAHLIDLRLSKPEGAMILSAVTGAFTVGRGVGVPLAIWLPPETLLVGSLVLVAFGNTVLVVWANTSLQALWAGAVTLGIGFATVFPSFYGYIEKHVEITDFVGGVLTLASSINPSIYPFIIGSNIEAHPFIMTYINYCSLGICTVVLAILFSVTRK